MAIDTSANIISDLKIVSDDLSFAFIPDLEDKFEVRGSRDDFPFYYWAQW